MIITNRTSMHTKPSVYKGKDQAARNQSCLIIPTPQSLGFGGGWGGRCLTPFCCNSFFLPSCLLLSPPFSFYCNHLCLEAFVTPLAREKQEFIGFGTTEKALRFLDLLGLRTVFRKGLPLPCLHFSQLLLNIKVPQSTLCTFMVTQAGPKEQSWQNQWQYDALTPSPLHGSIMSEHRQKKADFPFITEATCRGTDLGEGAPRGTSEGS